MATRTITIKVENPKKLKPIPVITADQIMNRKGNNIMPAFCRVIFLILNRKKKEIAETDIIAKTISSILYKYKCSSCQTP